MLIFRAVVGDKKFALRFY